LATIELTQQCNMTVTDLVVEGTGEFGVVAWLIGSGLYTFYPTSNLGRIGVDCFDVTKET
jgi:hypothetical protein